MKPVIDIEFSNSLSESVTFQDLIDNLRIVIDGVDSQQYNYEIIMINSKQI